MISMTIVLSYGGKNEELQLELPHEYAAAEVVHQLESADGKVVTVMDANDIHVIDTRHFVRAQYPMPGVDE